MDLRHNGTTLAVLVILFGTFTLSVFILRIWFRVTRRKYNCADTILTASVICGIIQSIVWLLMVFSFGYGKLKADIPPSVLKAQWAPKLLYMNQIIFKLTTPLCKLSLCVLYQTICAASSGRVVERTRVAIWLTITLIIGAYASALVVSIFQCTPIRKVWEPKTQGSCIDVTKFRYSTAVLNIATSLMVITLPIPVLLKLKHQRPEIKQLIGLVLLGLIHTSLTIARFAIMFFPDPWIKTEPLYGWVPAQTLAVCEMNANILFATLVVMRPAFQAIYHVIIPRSTRRIPSVSTGSGQPDSKIASFRRAWTRHQIRWLGETDLLQTTHISTMHTIEESRMSQYKLQSTSGDEKQGCVSSCTAV
ncbi:hypothetical protein FB567DRAFT_543985 [Paraphoma chrysanthemicola]|uniref:Rhodopsin domain-containing protein n=1 Tax=Paraphoma chrysanthemicola TaxID=798071 RepID=A0A8K0RKY8_9PLEO|nr:hypothetical protein FB567DRAFT_543985 [Paraphoma chrysanthemicola]